MLRTYEHPLNRRHDSDKNLIGNGDSQGIKSNERSRPLSAPTLLLLSTRSSFFFFFFFTFRLFIRLLHPRIHIGKNPFQIQLIVGRNPPEDDEANPQRRR